MHLLECENLTDTCDLDMRAHFLIHARAHIDVYLCDVVHAYSDVYLICTM